VFEPMSIAAQSIARSWQTPRMRASGAPGGSAAA